LDSIFFSGRTSAWTKIFLLHKHCTWQDSWAQSIFTVQ
jgi:hypothetical protein